MKRAERHHLKNNELVRAAATARQVVEERRGQLITVSVAVVAVLAIVIGYVTWTGRTTSNAHALLAGALAVEEARVGPAPAPGSPAPPGLTFETSRAKYEAALAKYKAVADGYGSTDAGLFARYKMAATDMALGDAKSAVAAYQQVIDRAGDSLTGQAARLGLAEAQAQTGQYDQAIAAFKELAQRKDGAVPTDGILLSLGRTCVDAGKKTDAEQAFTRLVDEFPDSPFSADARRELDELKKT